MASILLKGYEQSAFRLTQKINTLAKCNGIIWNVDLCLRYDALEHFVRLQDGYGNYMISKITQELRDMGVLVIQESGTYQVHLKRGFQRVYRIRLDALRHYAKEF